MFVVLSIGCQPDEPFEYRAARAQALELRRRLVDGFLCVAFNFSEMLEKKRNNRRLVDFAALKMRPLFESLICSRLIELKIEPIEVATAGVDRRPVLNSNSKPQYVCTQRDSLATGRRSPFMKRLMRLGNTTSIRRSFVVIFSC